MFNHAWGEKPPTAEERIRPMLEYVAKMRKNEEQKMAFESKLSKANPDKRILLNIGGRQFQTTQGTLFKISEDNYFTIVNRAIVEGRLKKDEKGQIFIDRNGDLFVEILDYLRNGVNYIVPDQPRLRRRLLNEAEFYQLPVLTEMINEAGRKELFRASTLLTTGEQHVDLNKFYDDKNEGQYVHFNKFYDDKNEGQYVHFNKFYDDKNIYQHWTLIYRATRDGFDAFAFHRRCDSQGPSMTIIQSKEGHLFGVYASRSWLAPTKLKKETHIHAPTSFLFILAVPEFSAKARRISSEEIGSDHLINRASYGPTFGKRKELYVSDLSNMNSNSYFHYIKFRHTTSDSYGEVGPHQFQTKEIEVFKLLVE